MDWKKSNKIVALIILIFTTIVYTLTVAPTVSFWDCGEFIATSYRMSVPHPPGAPLFLLVGRIFSLIPFADDVALRTNMISVFSSSITIMLLYLIIVRLVREWKGKLESQEDWLVAICSGVIGSLTFAFTHSFWFNSAESEVYAASMLFTSLLVWLSLVWAEKSNEKGNEKYLLMISYLIGLAIAVHLLNVLALPFVAMVFYYKRYKFEMKTFMIMTASTIGIILFVYPGIVKILPQIADFNLFLFSILIIAIFVITYWAILQKKHLMSFIMLSITLIIIGYTSYGIIPIRSNLNPNIDENNPETVDNFLKYINREQYGDHSITNRTKVWKQNPQTASHYSSAADFFWSYQINHMYVRYFLWQFVGMAENGNVNFQFFALPLLFGLLGMYFQFKKDPRHALAVLALFVTTGLAIILYLNQPDPQPRERDYSYVGSFFAFAIWVGFGYAAIIDLIKEFLGEKADKAKKIGKTVFISVFVVLLIASPLQILAKNFHTHNRTGNYVAWDYSYNILISCDKDAILFTNGDNDTFPLWYLQEVEDVRTDVRIVNLSLLNTDWYIKQLRDEDPKVPMRISEEQIKHIQPVPWETREVSLKIPKKFEKEYQKYRQTFAVDAKEEMPKEMTFRVAPTITMRNYKLLRVQDYMILNILAANQWKKPVYFATTVPQSNLVDGLAAYLRMEGLVMKVVPFKNWRLSADNMYNNLVNKYQYRFQDPSVYYNPSAIGLLQNYRTAFIGLGEYYATIHNTSKLKDLFEFEAKNIPNNVIPWPTSGNASVLTYRMMGLKSIYDPSIIDSALAKEKPNALASIGRSLMGLQQFKKAARLLGKAYDEDPTNPRYISMLIQAYQLTGDTDKAIDVLEKWIELNPADSRAKSMLAQLKLNNKHQ